MSFVKHIVWSQFFQSSVTLSYFRASSFVHRKDSLTRSLKDRIAFTAQEQQNKMPEPLQTTPTLSVFRVLPVVSASLLLRLPTQRCLMLICAWFPFDFKAPTCSRSLRIWGLVMLCRDFSIFPHLSTPKDCMIFIATACPPLTMV